jgi:hypothetical protein
MAGKRIPRKLTAAAHDFGLGVAIAGGVAMVLVLALVLSRSGVSGTVTAPVCNRSFSTPQRCSIEPTSARIVVTSCLGADLTAPSRKWETDADSQGRFDLALPPGGYCLAAQVEPKASGYGGSAAFPVFAGRITHVDLFLPYRNISGGICLPASARIATPTGSVPVSQLRPGMTVWTLDASDRRVAAPIVVVSHVPAPNGHHVLRLLLADGRSVEASAGHPTVTGRTVGALRPGDLLDGSPVTAIGSVSYTGDTWDLLPAGSTGSYWADDVLLGSTLLAPSVWPAKPDPSLAIHSA